MDTQHRTEPLPPPAAPTREPSRLDSEGGGIIILIFLLGLVAWGVGVAMWANADDAVDPAKNYTATVALAVVGAALMICAAIYDRR